MYNIWGFLLQTTAVSVVAAIILFLKKIFEDKLSPKWQYCIWTLLAIRILVPVNLGSYILPPVALWMEMLKAGVEKLVSSVYTYVYEPIILHHVFPLITDAPQSATDWLFVIYSAGVLFFLLKYLIAYIRLRVLLKHGSKVSSEIEQKMLAVCDTYNLKGCKMVAANGLTSAFICGVFRPILVVPAESDVDEKVFLHELLHLKNHDTIQNVGWCILRSLHWCNPFMQFVINHIENDMESMCDQRVLELLEGEERREYGHILLHMANQKYSRIPGTTSISNGGNNISKRIAAIVRFKKYPQGMTLVSVCIILTMFWPTIVGNAASYDSLDFIYYHDEADKSMAIARVNRCGTIAGAIDMYVKGLYEMNGAYVATAVPFSEHERISNELEEYGCYQRGKYITNINQLYNYRVYNVDEQMKNHYTGILVLYANISVDEYVPELKEYISDDLESNYCDAYIIIPISVWKENGSWVLKETEERSIVAAEKLHQENSSILFGKEYYGKNETGEVRLILETKYEVENTQKSNANMSLELGGSSYSVPQFDITPNPNAAFSIIEINHQIEYHHLSDTQPKSYVELLIGEQNWRLYETITPDWDGNIIDGVSGDIYYNRGTDYEVDFVVLDSSYEANLNIDGNQMDTILLEEVTN